MINNLTVLNGTKLAEQTSNEVHAFNTSNNFK